VRIYPETLGLEICPHIHGMWLTLSPQIPGEHSDPDKTSFDLFIIIMAIFNALDRPYQRQADVMTSLQNDGARMFVVRRKWRIAFKIDIATVFVS
jgi:hypothetical protein